MTTSVTYSVKNGVLVQDGLDPLAGIRPPGPGTCINCGEHLRDLTKHWSHYTGYMCTWQSLPGGADPRPFVMSTFGDGTFGSSNFGFCD